ncbi:MAG: hypothetical protein OEV92_04055, partial [Nitrospinota bacterium]|nr:hypothetical protein [Nitrospinota bacterium]
MRYFGMEAGPSFIRVAVVEKTVRGGAISRLVAMNLPGENTAAEVAEFMSRLGYDKERDTLSAVFPGQKITLRSFVTPLTRRRQIADTLPFELESRVPLGADEFTAGFLLTGKSEEGSNVLAALAKNEDIASGLASLGEAGLDPDFLAPGPLAPAAGLGRAGGTMNEVCAVAHGGADGTYITILGQTGAPLTFHTCDAGPGALESVPREVDRMLLGLNRDAPELKLGAVILSGGFDDIGALTARLQEKFQVPVAQALVDDAPQPEINGAPGPGASDKALFLAALGAANMAAEDAADMNLRSGGFKKISRHGKMNSEALVATALLGVVLALWAALYIGEGVRMRSEYAAQKMQIRSLFKSVMPPTTAIVSEKQQLLAELNKLEKASSALGVSGGKDPFLNILRDVTLAKPEGTRLDIDTFTFEPGRLILAG